MALLSRDKFRTLTLARFAHQCAVKPCGKQAVDAHHILNRHLFTAEEQKGGYFLNNGAGLCEAHHWEAEATVLTCQQLYTFCLIEEPVFPLGWDEALTYDTWGNVILSDYARKPGPLFRSEGCQKMLKRQGLLWQFYPV